MTFNKQYPILDNTMTTTISMTSRGQIHIPKAMREELGMYKPGMLKITLANNTITLKPVKSKFLEAAGKYAHYRKGKEHIDINNIRDSIDYSDL